MCTLLCIIYYYQGPLRTLLLQFWNSWYRVVISYFCRSESISQVFIVIVSWLYLLLCKVPKSMWNGVWLAYDNMCNLQKFKACRSKLPVPKPFDRLWKKINKMIDGLHLQNHVNPSCKVDLHPDRIHAMYPDLEKQKNTMAAEQTFVWLSRYKKIMTSMPKQHHLFYLHRLVKRRNLYTSKCYKFGLKPLLPKRRNKNST